MIGMTADDDSTYKNNSSEMEDNDENDSEVTNFNYKYSYDFVPGWISNANNQENAIRESTKDEIYIAQILNVFYTITCHIYNVYVMSFFNIYICKDENMLINPFKSVFFDTKSCY